MLAVVTPRLGPTLPSQVEGHYPVTLLAFGTATIDGVISPGEYGASGCVSPPGYGGTQTYTQGATTTYTVTKPFLTLTFCEMNDQQNDYYAFQISDLTPEPTDAFYLFFDNNHDGLVEQCTVGKEDAIGVYQTSVGFSYGDFHYCAPMGVNVEPWNVLIHDFQPGGQLNVVGAAVWSPTGYTFEIGHPLNSGDGNLDYALSTTGPNNFVGWCLTYKDGSDPSGPSAFLDFPVDCYTIARGPAGDASKYGDIRKLPAGEPTTTTTKTTTTNATTTTTRTTNATTTTRTTTTCTGATINGMGLIAWWKVDETWGTTVTDIIGGYHGTAQPGPIGPFTGAGPVTSTLWPPPTFPPGMVGNSLFFYGNRHVQVPHNPALNPATGDFTIDAWVIYSAAGNGQFLTIARKAKGNAGVPTTSPPGTSGYQLIIHDSNPTAGTLIFDVYGSMGLPFSTTITPNTWHHVAFTLQTVSGGQVLGILYLDGAAIGGAPTFYGNIANTYDLLIGGDGVFAGEIAVDEVQIWNRALSQSEIQAIYNATGAGKCVPITTTIVSTTCVPGTTLCSTTTITTEIIVPEFPSTFPVVALTLLLIPVLIITLKRLARKSRG